MKKILAAVAMMAVSMFASAQSTSGFASGLTAKIGYDYDSLESRTGTRQELQVGLGYKLPFGTVDGVLMGDRYRFKPARASNDDINGFEVGYALPMYRLGVAGIRTRAAYGHMNQIDPSGSGFKGNFGYYSLAIEGAYPLTDRLSSFVGYRFRDSFNSTVYRQNRTTLGVDYDLTKTVSARVGYAHTNERGLGYNGITTALGYKF